MKHMTKSPFYKREQNDAVVEKHDIKAGNLWAREWRIDLRELTFTSKWSKSKNAIFEKHRSYIMANISRQPQYPGFYLPYTPPCPPISRRCKLSPGRAIQLLPHLNKIDFWLCTVPEALSVKHFERESTCHFKQYTGRGRADNKKIRGDRKWRARHAQCDRNDSNSRGTGTWVMEPSQGDHTSERSRIGKKPPAGERGGSLKQPVRTWQNGRSRR